MSLPKNENSEIFVPPFPALHMTVIVDARFSSRQAMVKDLKSGGLFEVIVEAKSLADALRILSNHEVDACLLGPSVTLEGADSLIRQGSTSTLSKDCAFVALIHQDSPNEASLIESGAHGTIKTPCSKLQFTEALVRAVVKANGNGTWARMLKQAEDAGMDLFTPGNPISPQDRGQQNKLDSQLRSLAIERLIDRPSLEITNLIEKIKGGEYGFDANGKPSKATVQAVTELVLVILRGNSDLLDSTTFGHYLNQSILLWIIDLRRLPDREATEKLKQSIAAFSSQPISATKKAKK